MNNYQLTLYCDLMDLVEHDEAFFYADKQKEDQTYRIFNYRLVSYSGFLKPNALECRGVMFNITDLNNIALVSLPMEKFFNLHENPFTANVDLNTVVDVEHKADGSLISTYIHNEQVYLKTKGSLESDQCIAAHDYLNKPDHINTKYAIAALANNNCTVNMEWCAPDNRIVIGYQQPHLKILNVRSNVNGQYVDVFSEPTLQSNIFDDIRENHVGKVEVHDPVGFVEDIPAMEGIEGYIITLDTGQRIKIKTEWYLVQHRAKDSINSDRRLYQAILNETSDDLRSLFHDDLLVIQRIDRMERQIGNIYNHLVDTVERFYHRNKKMDRKSYAILATEQLTKIQFGLAMNKYSCKPINYKTFMATRWKDFGIDDQQKTDT